MTKTILLTRSKEDNQTLKDILTPKGYNCIECSLLKSVNIPFDPKALDPYNNIITTSKRAAKLMPRANKNAWVVGNSSAEILRQKNYNIKYIAASASELKDHIPKDIYSSTIYPASNMISVEMPDDIKVLQVYKVIYKDELSKDEIKLIKDGIDYIALYSENCAKTLLKLIVENNLLKYLENTMVIAISSKVEMVVKDYFKNRRVCREVDVMARSLPQGGDVAIQDKSHKAF